MSEPCQLSTKAKIEWLMRRAEEAGPVQVSPTYRVPTVSVEAPDLVEILWHADRAIAVLSEFRKGSLLVDGDRDMDLSGFVATLRCQAEEFRKRAELAEIAQVEMGKHGVKQKDSDLATLERLLRCPCGGWLEVCEAARHLGFDAFCLRCRHETTRDTPAEAVMAFHREHGGER